MFRENAIKILANNEFDSLNTSMAQSIIEDFWNVDESDNVWYKLPDFLKNELKENDPPIKPDKNKYKELLLYGLSNKLEDGCNSFLELELTRIGIHEKIFGVEPNLISCECCGYRSLRHAEFEICEVCYWQNCGGNVVLAMSLNKKSLHSARLSFSQIDVSSEQYMSVVSNERFIKYVRGNL